MIIGWNWSEELIRGTARSYFKGPLPRGDKDFARFGHLSPESANAILVLSRHTGITLREL